MNEENYPLQMWFGGFQPTHNQNILSLRSVEDQG